jgi:hypothetical protein
VQKRGTWFRKLRELAHDFGAAICPVGGGWAQRRPPTNLHELRMSSGKLTFSHSGGRRRVTTRRLEEVRWGQGAEAGHVD